MDTSALYTLTKSQFPPLLKEISDPPQKLYIRGTFPSDEYKFLCVVGSRKYSQYGKDVCEKLIMGLSGYPVIIVSGLALGIDAIAHQTALKAGLITLAVPGSGLSEEVLYPRSHIGLAREITMHGGALISEFESDFIATQWSFPQRNRLMAGMSHAVLIIEAEEQSGTLITARLGMEYNRDVLIVPGSILSPHTKGSNRLLRDGAQAVTSSEEILEVLKIPIKAIGETRIVENLSLEEEKIINLLSEPLTRDELIEALDIPVSKANILISALELKGFICERLGKIYRDS